MKHKFKLTRLWVASLLLLFGFTTNAWGYNFKNPYIYFNNADLNWNPAMLFVGHSNYSAGYNQTSNPLADTKLVYFHPDANWGDQTDFTIGNTSNWGAEYNSFDSRVGYMTHIGIQKNYGFDENNTYYVTGTAGSSPTINVSYCNGGHSALPKKNATSAVKVRTSSSASYTNATGTWPAKINLKGTYMSGNGTTARSTISSTAGNSQESDRVYGVVITGKVSMSYENLSNDYTFDGWGESTPSNTADYYITDDKTIYAFFTAKHTVTFGTPGNGSLGAKISSTSISSGTKQADGSKIVFTATPSIGYEVEGWYSNSTCTSQIADTDTETTYTINSLTADATVYVKFKKSNYSITYTPSLAVNFTYKTAPNNADYNTNVAMEFTPDANYVIASVTAYKTGASSTEVTVTKTDDTHYSFTQPAYNVTVKVEVSLSQVQVTYGKVGEGTIVGKVGETNIGASPASVDGGATVVFTATPDANYTVEGWYSNSTCTGDELQQGDNTGNPQTYTILNIAEARTVYVKFQETKHAVTISKGTGISSVTPSGERQVGNVTPVEISATVATGYTWSQWTKTGDVTIADAFSSSTSIKATGTGTVTATATEILLPLTTSVTESYMGFVDKTASSIGVVTSSQLTASSANRNYKFKQWHLTNCTITSGTVNDATITIKGDGVNNPSAEAEFEVAWLISGNDDISTGWGASGTKMTVVSDGVFKFEFNATKVASNDGDYNFKVYNTVRSAYYANTAGDGGWWFTRSAASAELAEGVKADKNMSLRSDMVGNYIFTLDCSTSRESPTLTVTFPTTTTYDVDIYYDGVTKTTVEGGAFAKEITANVPQSMRFDHWVVEGETTHVNITDENSQTTTFTASGTGAIIRAKFKVVGVMYLKASDVFGEAYVNFYSKDGYWSNDKGSGNKGSNCMSRNRQMTKIGKTDIYYFDVSGGIDKWTWQQAFSFVNKSVEHDNFSMCNVVYRSDYNDRLPLYVPRYGYITHYFIECHYYNDGIWMKYNDTYSGYKLWIKEQGHDETAQSITLNALSPGGYEFNTTLNLKSGTTYELQIYNENSEWYGVTGQTITASSCSNWHFWKGQGNCKLTASDAGDYTFTLNLGSGEVIISVQYPLAANDYRVIAKNGNDIVKYGDLIKNSGEAIQKDTVSFFNSNYTFRLQKYAGNDTWNEYGDEVTPTAEGAQEGVIDFIVEQDGQGNATLAYKGIYTGNYYIRTDGVDGGWGDYKNNSDNKMDNYGSLIDADPTYQYDVYKAKWILSGKNVKFCVANDYSKAISGEFTTDAIINDKETLPEGANVRFMWNSQTNQLKRAYLSGSTIISDRFLVLEGDAKMFDKDGKALTTDGGGKIADLNDYELNFDDKNNWVYQADIQAQPGCEVKLTAKYNGNIQYFIGKAGDGADSRRKIIDGNGSSMYSLRAVYDFKTNRLVTGWIPNGTITENIVLGSDMLIERIEQGDASQIVFGGDIPSSLSISNIQHIYGVLKLTKATMLTATESTFDKCVYWISFPFDVKVSEIFGVEKYGEVWAITKYNGEKRAEKGWFKQDTQTFWEFLKPSDIMKANVGYTLNLDPDYFNKESSEPWKASATEVAWYFPSIKENVGVVSLAQKDTTLQPMHCTIDRTFDPGDGRTLNHKFTDSNWRVIGVPAFQNLQAPTFDPVPGGDGTEFGLKGFYEWVPATNTYTARSASGYTFKATGAYMVQYEGKITWSDAAVITTKAPWHAPEYTYADAKNYSITLEFGNDDYTDQTFVTLIEKASTDFVLNEDMMKIDNAGVPNIYSFAGAYDVAYNETTFENQSVMLGVSAPKNDTYTFSMPKEFSGKAVLVDLETGEATDLNVSNYTVDLNKGTYNNRFQLLLEVEAKVPTSIQADRLNGGEAEGKTLKLLRNGNIYLINGGRVYNATGAELR